MSHDLEASYAAAEVAAHVLTSPSACFVTPPDKTRLSAYAAREGKNTWPHADGVIELSVTTGGKNLSYSVALEFKRLNEGLHGVLTAIGQSHAYLRKGYSGSVIVIPEAYSGLVDSGAYVKDVLNLTSKAEAIGVYAYKPPDLSKASPFEGRLNLVRPFKVDAQPPILAPVQLSRTETQWAHVREGSTDPDAFFKYLQAVKLLSGGGLQKWSPAIPPSLAGAAKKAKPDVDPDRYLSNCTNNDLKDQAWRYFWFNYVLWPSAIDGWTRTGSGQYVANETPLKIKRSDGKGDKVFFAGRSDSIKNSLAQELNARTTSESEALVKLATNYHSRAHSYREDIDSGCEHLGFIDSEGRLTDGGYRFVDACERTGDPNQGLPRALFLSAVLGEGGLGAFLHYVYRLSEEAFRSDPLAFSEKKGAAIKFKQGDYLQWIEQQMSDRLRVIRKVSLRGGTQRKPFQAELALLRGLGIVSDGFRIGVGLVINWLDFQEALDFQKSSSRIN